MSDLEHIKSILPRVLAEVKRCAANSGACTLEAGHEGDHENAYWRWPDGKPGQAVCLVRLAQPQKRKAVPHER